MCAISGHSRTPHYGRRDTWRWFTPFVPDLSLPLQRLHWVWGKAFTAIIPVSRCHGNTVCYVTLHFFHFLIWRKGSSPSLQQLSKRVSQALHPDSVTTGQMCQYVDCRITKTDVRDRRHGQMSSCPALRMIESYLYLPQVRYDWLHQKVPTCRWIL